MTACMRGDEYERRRVEGECCVKTQVGDPRFSPHENPVKDAFTWRDGERWSVTFTDWQAVPNRRLRARALIALRLFLTMTDSIAWMRDLGKRRDIVSRSSLKDSGARNVSNLRIWLA